MPKWWPTSCQTVLADLLGVRVRGAEDDDPLQPADRVVDPHQPVGVRLLDDHRDLAEPLAHPVGQRVERLDRRLADLGLGHCGLPSNPMRALERVRGVEQLRLGERRRGDLQADRQLGPAARRRRASPAGIEIAGIPASDIGTVK